MEKDKSKTTGKAAECVDAYRSIGEETDPLGSYTGNPRPELKSTGSFGDTAQNYSQKDENIVDKADFFGVEKPRPEYDGGAYLHDALGFKAGVWSTTRDAGLISTGIYSPVEINKEDFKPVQDVDDL